MDIPTLCVGVLAWSTRVPSDHAYQATGRSPDNGIPRRSLGTRKKAGDCGEVTVSWFYSRISFK